MKEKTGDMMGNIKISVILPVYNTENYLEEALDSILNQTMIDDIEVLMLDDGSDDDSRYIIEKYALDYENFHAFHNENMGQGRERNFGIKHAKGEYIHFMDADDYILPDAYEKLYEAAKSDNYDFVMGKACRFTKNSNWNDLLYDHIYKDIEDFLPTTIRQTNSLVYNTTCWDKLIKRDFILKNDICFPDENIIAEDVPFMMKMHDMAHEIGMMNDNIYYWRYRSDLSSDTQQKDIQKFKDRIISLNILNEYLEDNNVEKEIKEAVYYKWLTHDLKIYFNRFKEYSPEDVTYLIDEINKVTESIPDDIKLRINSYLKVMYKIMENKDIDCFNRFADKENKIKTNPSLLYDIEDEYKNLIDFKADAQKEELVAYLKDIKVKNNKMNLDIEAYVPFLESNSKDTIEFNLIKSYSDNQKGENNYSDNQKGENNYSEYKYELNGNKNNLYSLTIPYDDLKNLNGRFNISISYKNENFDKKCLLMSKKGKRILNLKDLEIFSRFGLYRVFNLDINKKIEERILVDSIELIKTEEKHVNPLLNNSLLVNLESDKKIDSLIVENIVSLQEREYEINNVSCDKNMQKYELKIPFEDLLQFPIRKFRIKTKNGIDLKIKNSFSYRNKKIMIDCMNEFNRLFVYIKYYYPFEEIENLERKINKIENLRRKINRFHGEKLIKIAKKLT